MKGVIALGYGYYNNSIGGVNKVIAEHQKKINNLGFRYIYICPAGKNIFDEKRMGRENDKIYSLLCDGKIKCIGNIEEIYKWFCKRNYYCYAFYVHHSLRWSLSDLEFILNIYFAPVYWYLHDYYTVCPSYNLLNRENRYCGFPTKKCDGCFFEHSPNDITVRNKSYNILFKKIRKRLVIISPSEITKEIYIAAFPAFEKNVEVVPHWDFCGEVEEMKRISTNKINIAFIGTMQSNKGSNEWEELIRVIDRKHYNLFHLGKRYSIQENVKNISVLPGEMVLKLIENKIDIVFLWSTWPETFSYTYFEAYSAGCYILTSSDSGNIAFMVKKNGNGEVFKTISECITFLNSRECITFLNSREKRKRLFIESDYISSTLTQKYSLIKIDVSKKNSKFFRKIREYGYFFLRSIYKRRYIKSGGGVKKKEAKINSKI